MTGWNGSKSLLLTLSSSVKFPRIVLRLGPAYIMHEARSGHRLDLRRAPIALKDWRPRWPFVYHKESRACNALARSYIISREIKSALWAPLFDVFSTENVYRCLTGLPAHAEFIMLLNPACLRNTPWMQTHVYVPTCRPRSGGKQQQGVFMSFPSSFNELVSCRNSEPKAAFSFCVVMQN